MRIAYVLYPEVIISNKSNGIRSQALSWARMLEMLGHKVDLVNNWDGYNWKEYDVIHMFGSGGSWTKNVLKRLVPINSNIVISPIIDPLQTESFVLQKLRANIGRYTRNVVCTNDSLVQRGLVYGKVILARSEYEKKHLTDVYKVPFDKIEVVPLSYSEGYSSLAAENPEKQKFCFHISSIYQERKNVVRLIRAAKKYDFHLVLAGNKGSEKDFSVIEREIASSKKIDVLGFISEQEKIDLYKRAKVFALPSVQEGVGIVALDAALFGCEIAITNIPGPKEYYGNMCLTYNPYSVDEIGSAVKKLLDGEISFQPDLKNHIEKFYSEKKVSEKLLMSYNKVLNHD